MKTGELYTPKNGACSLLNFREGRKELWTFGFVVIQLKQYIGNDLWEFENCGTSWIGPLDDELSSISRITGQRVHEEYVLIGEAGDGKTLKELEKWEDIAEETFQKYFEEIEKHFGEDSE